MKQHHTLLVLVLVVLMAIPTHMQLCALASRRSDLLQSGYKYLYKSDFVKEGVLSFQTFYFSVGFAIPSRGLQVVASIEKFSMSSTRGINFVVAGGRNTGSSMGFVVVGVTEPYKWRWMKVRYLASSRTDFVLGYFKVDPRKESRVGTTVTTRYFTIPGWNRRSGNIAYEFSGLYTSAVYFNVTLKSRRFQPTNNRVRFVMNVDPISLVPLLYISYVAYTTSSPFKRQYFSPTDGSDFPYQFSGIDRASKGKARYSGNAFTQGYSCRNSKCWSKCVSRLSCILQSGYISGNSCIRS